MAVDNLFRLKYVPETSGIYCLCLKLSNVKYERLCIVNNTIEQYNIV